MSHLACVDTKIRRFPWLILREDKQLAAPTASQVGVRETGVPRSGPDLVPCDRTHAFPACSRPRASLGTAASGRRVGGDCCAPNSEAGACRGSTAGGRTAANAGNFRNESPYSERSTGHLSNGGIHPKPTMHLCDLRKCGSHRMGASRDIAPTKTVSGKRGGPVAVFPTRTHVNYRTSGEHK